MAGLAALIVAGALFAFFRYTRTGKAIRACGDNYMGALVVGLDVRRLFALTFGIGSACLGAAGAILLLLIDVHPYLGPAYTLLAFIIVIVGGMGSLPGAMLGGILIGTSEALAGVILQPSLKTAFSFSLLILVLLLRPQGLLGKPTQ
jgi:branched-chain amino acid transport system permease protein